MNFSSRFPAPWSKALTTSAPHQAFHSSQPPPPRIPVPNGDCLRAAPVISPQPDLTAVPPAPQHPPFAFLQPSPTGRAPAPQAAASPLNSRAGHPSRSPRGGREAGRGRGRRARPGSAPRLAPVEDPLHLGEVLGRDVLLQARLQRLQHSRHGAADEGRGDARRPHRWARADR